MTDHPEDIKKAAIKIWAQLGGSPSIWTPEAEIIAAGLAAERRRCAQVASDEAKQSDENNGHIFYTAAARRIARKITGETT